MTLLECGSMVDTDWMAMADFLQPRGEFRRDVVQLLLGWKLIEQHEDEYRICKAGLQYLGVLPATEDPGAPTPGRYIPPREPLSARHRPALGVMRPGAFDYRDIPSRHADASVPFKTSIKREREQG